MPVIIKTLFLLLSFTCFFFAFHQLKIHFSPKEFIYETVKDETVYPSQIILPSQELSLPVYPVEKKNDHLPTIDNGVSFLKNSSIPGNFGTSLFYGHNWLSLLGKLKQVKIGQSIIIRLSNQKELQYSIDQISIVTPNDQFLPQSETESRLVIYTCAGIFDEKRLLVSAKLNSDQE